MKSERRHELHTNSLAAMLSHAPEFLRTHGAKILLGVIIALLAGILINQRIRRNQEQLDAGWSNISSARTSMERIQALPRMIEAPEQLATARKQLIDATNQALAPIMASDNRQIAAEAYLLRGDLNWTTANLPAIAVATTQPAMQIEGTPADHLLRAQEAYEKVIRVYADQTTAATSARFGLAAIAENRRDFDTASRIYGEIKADATSLAVYQLMAESRLKMMTASRAPIYVVPATLPATQPAIPAGSK